MVVSLVVGHEDDLAAVVDSINELQFNTEQIYITASDDLQGQLVELLQEALGEVPHNVAFI